MICSHCNTPNPEGCSYCQGCGSPLAESNNSYRYDNVQPQQFRQDYRQNNMNNSFDESDGEPVSVLKWLGAFLLASIIPLVYFIMLLIWGFGNTQNKTFKNFAKAQLIMMGIAFVLTVIFVIAFVGMFGLGASGTVY